MAAKRKLEFEESSPVVKRFIHQLSSIKRSRNNNLCSDCVLQMSRDEYTRFISFVPERHTNFRSAAVGKSPVKLQNTQLSPLRGKMEILFKRESTVSVIVNLPYPNREPRTLTSDEKTLEQIKDISDPFDRVTVAVKILGKINETETVQTSACRRKVQAFVVADKSTTIELSAWENHIESLVTKASYKITYVAIKSFNNQIKLSTTPQTEVCPIEDIHDASTDVASILSLQTVDIRVMQVQAVETRKCPSCFKSIEVTQDTIVRCSTCKVKFKTRDIPLSMHIKVNCSNQSGNVLKLTIFKEQMQELLIKEKKEELLNNVENVEDFLLEEQFFTIKIKDNSEVVEDISKQNTDAEQDLNSV